MEQRTAHHIGFNHSRLRWIRLLCWLVGHAEWRDLRGRWFCMRCLSTRDLELRWVEHPTDAASDQRALVDAFRATARRISSRLAASRSRPRG